MKRPTTNRPSNHSEKGKDKKKLLLPTTTISGYSSEKLHCGKVVNMPYLHGMLLLRAFPGQTPI